MKQYDCLIGECVFKRSDNNVFKITNINFSVKKASTYT